MVAVELPHIGISPMALVLTLSLNIVYCKGKLTNQEIERKSEMPV